MKTMIKFKLWHVLTLILLITGNLSLIALPALAQTASLSLSPASGTFNQGCTFSVEIKVDTGGNQTDGTDAILFYDPTRFTATDIGTIVTELLKEHFSHIVDYDFTAEMETNLDEIAHKKTPWRDVIKSFYVPFAKNLEQKYKEIDKKSLTEEKTDITCPLCKTHTLIIKIGRFGKFLACPGYPDCKHTQLLETTDSSSDVNAQNSEPSPLCESCNIKMILKEGRYGKFFA